MFFESNALENSFSSYKKSKRKEEKKVMILS